MEKILTSKGPIDINIPGDAMSKIDSSGDYSMVCPICSGDRKADHKKQRVFAVNLLKPNRPWRCNHCGEAGYVVDEEYMLRAKIKPILDHKDFMPLSDPLVEWFWTERGISKQTLIDLDISSSVEPVMQNKHVEGEEHLRGTFVTKRCINFKYKKDGMLINIKYRDKNKNFKMISEASKIFYNIDALKGKKEAVIVEGEMDVLAYHEAGVKFVVSVPNGVTISDVEKEEYHKTGHFRQNLNMEYLDLCMAEFTGIETIYLATDDDLPGIKLRSELARRLGKERCRYIKFSEYKRNDGSPCKDANEVLKNCGKDSLQRTLSFAHPYPISGVTTAEDHWEKMEAIYDNGRKKGFSTGWKCLDPHWNWMKGWLITGNGFPGEGKSTFFFNMMITSAVLYGWKWGVYSPENYPQENLLDTFAEILVGDTADISFQDRMSKERYRNAKDFIKKHFFLVDNEEGFSPGKLREIKKYLIKQHGINGFLTDPWKNLYHDLGNMTIDMYLQRELAAEVRLAVHNEIVNVITHHPPTPEKSKDKSYAAPSPFELIGGQIWYASSYAMICIHKHDRINWKDTMTEIHIQKIKEHKLAGIPTDRSNPVLMRFDRRSGRLYEREDILDTNSHYKAFPFVDYLLNSQTVFDGF